MIHIASVTISNLANILYEMRGPMQTNYRKQHVFNAELSRKVQRDTYSGSKVRIPINLASLQGGGNPGEEGTINVPHALNLTKAEIQLQDVVQPFKITLSAKNDSKDNSAVEALGLLIKEARNSLAEIVNDQMTTTGALLATVTGGTSPGLVVTVSTSATQWDRVYAGRVVDVLTRSTGADPGQGLRRKIDSFDESAGTITFSTTSQASDGGSGNITIASTAGLYVAGVYTTTANNALAGIQDIASASGTFQTIDRSSVAGWKAVDGRGGTTTTAMLSVPMLDGGVRRGRRSGGFAWTFGIGDPAVIDGFKQGLYAQVRYSPQEATLKSGFKGIVYDGADRPIPLIKEDRYDRGELSLIPAEDLAIYGEGQSADFVDDDGAMFRRFDRNLAMEAWLRDRLQLAALRCNRVVFFNNLDAAA